MNTNIKEIQGWLTGKESEELQRIVNSLKPNSSVIEIGSWLGKSTAAIAQVTKAKGHAFTTIELNPTEANFILQQDGRYGFWVDGEQFSSVGADEYAQVYLPHLRASGGVVGELRRNLEARQLEDAVTILTGNFKSLELEAANFVYCDAMHDENEVDSNLVSVLALVKPGGVLAIHDSIWTQKYIESKVRFDSSHLIGR